MPSGAEKRHKAPQSATLTPYSHLNYTQSNEYPLHNLLVEGMLEEPNTENPLKP